VRQGSVATSPLRENALAEAKDASSLAKLNRMRKTGTPMSDGITRVTVRRSARASLTHPRSPSLSSGQLIKRHSQTGKKTRRAAVTIVRLLNRC
jgi:hypothetical protein